LFFWFGICEVEVRYELLEFLEHDIIFLFVEVFDDVFLVVRVVLLCHERCPVRIRFFWEGFYSAVRGRSNKMGWLVAEFIISIEKRFLLDSRE